MKKTIITLIALSILTACSSTQSELTDITTQNSKQNQTDTSQTYTFDQLTVVNNGLVEEDLELISDNQVCQKFKDNAYKVDFELTNNFDKQINFTGITFTDVWTTSSIMTTKISELGFEGITEQDPSDIASVMMTDTNDVKCFSQQNNRLNLQPGETQSYPLYFSVPPNSRYEDDTITLILGPNMHDYSDPTATNDFSAENIEFIQFEI